MLRRHTCDALQSIREIVSSNQGSRLEQNRGLKMQKIVSSRFTRGEFLLCTLGNSNTLIVLGPVTVCA